jgi:hypothetical protein
VQVTDAACQYEHVPPLVVHDYQTSGPPSLELPFCEAWDERLEHLGADASLPEFAHGGAPVSLPRLLVELLQPPTHKTIFLHEAFFL